MAALALEVKLKIKPESIEKFMQILIANGKASREKEPGCKTFDILVDEKDRTQILLYEVYDSDAAFEAHQQTAHFKNYLETAVPLLASRERRFWRRAAP